MASRTVATLFDSTAASRSVTSPRYPPPKLVGVQISPPASSISSGSSMRCWLGA